MFAKIMLSTIFYALMSFPALAAESVPVNGADWPQWRGPHRDGVVVESPPLLDAWPEDGPKLLWKSEVIPGLGTGGRSNNACVGGCGSVVVAGNDAVFYAHTQYDAGDATVSTEMLKKWGWEENVPEDLVKQVEAARSAKEKPRDKAARDQYIDAFLAKLDPAQAKQFESYIRQRVSDGKFSWELLVKVAKVRDQGFKNVYEMARAAGISMNPHAEGARLIVPVEATGRKIVDTIICLDVQTGRTRWKAEFEGGPGGHYNYGASGTPAIDGLRCYCAGSRGVYCVSMKDGKTLWEAKGSFTNTSPLVMDGLVYACFNDGLKAFDAGTGEVKWVQDKVANTSTSPSAWISEGRKCLVVPTDPVPWRHRGFDMACVDAARGELLWKSPMTFNYATPAIKDDLAVTFNKGCVSAHRLGVKGGKQAWRSKETYDERGGSATVVGDAVYVVGGGYRNSGAHCYDLKTGALKWSEKYDHTETGSTIVADGKVFAFATKKAGGNHKNHYLVMFRASPDKYEELGRMSHKSAGTTFNELSTPTLAGGLMFVRLRDAVACYDLRKE